MHSETSILSIDTRCPTCGARQNASATCRRCKCDLTLVLAAQRQKQALRRECLTCLARDDNQAALEAARRYCKLDFDKEAARLLAVVNLRLGRYQAALDVFEAARN